MADASIDVVVFILQVKRRERGFSSNSLIVEGVGEMEGRGGGREREREREMKEEKESEVKEGVGGGGGGGNGSVVSVRRSRVNWNLFNNTPAAEPRWDEPLKETTPPSIWAWTWLRVASFADTSRRFKTTHSTSLRRWPGSGCVCAPGRCIS